MSHLKSNYKVIEEKIVIKGIPIIKLKPEIDFNKYPSIIFYHGLDSKKENQRIRGYMLASIGYQVFLPDNLYHGERAMSLEPDLALIPKYFWEGILQSVEESEIIVEDIIENHSALEGEIYVSGHSMGGFITGGILTHNERVKGGIPINGSFNWEASNKGFLKELGLENLKIEKGDLENRIDKLDPKNNLDKLKKKEILILHGMEDDIVSIEPQREFYSLYKKENLEGKIIFKEYEGVGHFVTTGMMEDLIIWLKDGISNEEDF